MPSDTVKYSAKGFGQTNLTEKLPTYNRGEGERTLVHKNGSLIVLALMKKESQDFDGFDEDEKKQLYDELQGAAPEEDSTDAEAD